MKMNGLYAGSFNPFTNGHLSIVKEASQFFDTLYVCIAVNADKVQSDSKSIEEKIMAIDKSIVELGISNVKVIYHSGMIATLCKKLGVHYLVRGLRNTSDYLYEENIAKINGELNPDLRTIYFRSDVEVISSSLVRELMKYDEDVSKYVPTPILNMLIEEKILGGCHK